MGPWKALGKIRRVPAIEIYPASAGTGNFAISKLKPPIFLKCFRFLVASVNPAFIAVAAMIAS